MSNVYRLVIVDRQDLVRAGFKAALAEEEDLRVVGEASDVREAAQLCRDKRPDLAMMELHVPEMDSLAAIREIKQHLPDTDVMVLTLQTELDYMRQAIKAGATGYLLKDAPQHQLITAVRRVLAGEVAFTRELASRLLQQLASEGSEESVRTLPAPGRPPPIKPLTSRELEVLQLLALGHTNQGIAQSLVLSSGTAKNHVQNIKTKLEVTDRTTAVVRAFELGIIKLPDHSIE